MSKKILNLGAGNEPLEGAINHDKTQHAPYIDVAHDLNVLPWPFADEEFDRVYFKAVIEHLELTFLESLNEIWRITKPGGKLYLKYPLCTARKSYRDPTHRWFWDKTTVDSFDADTALGALSQLLAFLDGIDEVTFEDAVAEIQAWCRYMTHLLAQQEQWHGWMPATVDYFDTETKIGATYGFYMARKWKILKRNWHYSNCWVTLQKVK